MIKKKEKRGRGSMEMEHLWLERSHHPRRILSNYFPHISVRSMEMELRRIKAAGNPFTEELICVAVLSH